MEIKHADYRSILQKFKIVLDFQGVFVVYTIYQDKAIEGIDKRKIINVFTLPPDIFVCNLVQFQPPCLKKLSQL